MKFLSVTTVDFSQAKPVTPEMMQRMEDLITEMRAKGVLLDTGGRYPGMAAFTVVNKDGKDRVIDGPFAETKELVGGFAILECADRDEAIAWTKRAIEVVGNVTAHVHEIMPTPE